MIFFSVYAIGLFFFSYQMSYQSREERRISGHVRILICTGKRESMYMCGCGNRAWWTGHLRKSGSQQRTRIEWAQEEAAQCQTAARAVGADIVDIERQSWSEPSGLLPSTVRAIQSKNNVVSRC